MRKLTKEIFIEKAKKIHNDKYDYSNVVYINCDTPVCIICPEHGEFWQTPYNHSKGQGCPKCGIIKQTKQRKITLDEFKRRLEQNFGDKYIIPEDFVYKNNITKIKLICKKHGEFYISPCNLFKGQGCKLCSNETRSKKMSRGIDNFRELLYERFGNNITLTKDSIYVNNRTNIELRCIKHGLFQTKPYTILRSCGCYQCRNEQIAKNKIRKVEDVIDECNEKYNFYYTYDRDTYISTHNKMRIICPIHGEFWQSPHSHLSGQGCPKCKQSKLERKIMIFLQKKNIDFEYDIRLPWSELLRFDFYLPKYNLVIECQGQQHFEAVDFFHKETFIKVQERDKRKKRLCKENNVKICYYTELKEYDTFLGEKLYKDIDELYQNILVNYNI